MSSKAQGNPDKLPPGLGMLAGALAGTTQVIATNPMETVKNKNANGGDQYGKINIIKLGGCSRDSLTLSVVKDLGLKGLFTEDPWLLYHAMFLFQ